MDGLPIVIIFGLIALGKWLLENAGKSASDQEGGAGSDAGGPAANRPTTEDEAERMRRFMEALGLPRQAMPPPRVPTPPVETMAPQSPPPAAQQQRPQSRTQPTGRQKERRGSIAPRPRPERKKIAADLESITPMEPIAKAASMSETAPQMETLDIPSLDFAEPVREAERAVEAACIASGTSPNSFAGHGGDMRRFLQSSLRDRAQLRRALILKEILGPAKALQSSQRPSIFAAP